jgi:NAD+--asparagine ADP-ribosyltransferase
MSVIETEGLLRKRIKALDEIKGIIRGKCHSVYVLEMKHKISLMVSHIVFVKLHYSDRDGLSRHHI